MEWRWEEVLFDWVDSLFWHGIRSGFYQENIVICWPLWAHTIQRIFVYSAAPPSRFPRLYWPIQFWSPTSLSEDKEAEYLSFLKEITMIDPKLNPSKFGVGGTVRHNFYVTKDFLIELCSCRYLMVDMLLNINYRNIFDFSHFNKT